MRHQGNCCASTCEIPATWVSIRTQGTERCSCDTTVALARHKHTWISLRAQRGMFREKTAAFSRRDAASTHGSRSVRKQEDMFMRQTAASARHKHTWISFHAQRAMFRQSDCCVLTPPAHMDLAPCAKRHVPSKRLLRSRAAPKIDNFYLRTPDPVSTVKRAHVPYAIGNL